jgi:hypothetical protein
MEVLQRTANRGSVSTGYDIDNSVKLQTAAVNSEFFNYTIGTTGDRTKGTVSMWIKRTSLGTTQYLWEQSGADNDDGRTFARFQTDDTLRVAGGSTTWRNTNRVFRDTSAWYHIVIAFDTTQSTANNRIKVYVNGVQETSFSTTNNPSEDGNLGINFGAQYIGLSVEDSASYQSFNGYMAEVFGADGLVYAASDFGEFDSSGIWKPIDITGLSVGTNGFLMKFENAGSMGAATTGHGFSVQNINQNDQATDVPSNNFCTFNPLMTQNNPPTISDGAMASTGGGGTWNQSWGTIGVKNGKWYYEFIVTNASSTGYFGASTAPAEGSDTTGASLMYNTSFMVGEATGIDYYYWQNGSQVSDESTGWGGISTNDVIGIALDLDSATKTFTVYKNGTALSGTLSQPVDLPTNMQDEFIFPLYVQYEDTQDRANFGGFVPANLIVSAATDENGYGTFEYAPPSGYYALCTKNLAEFG